MSKKSIATQTSPTLALTDSMRVAIGMDSAARTNVAQALANMLSSSYMLYVKTLNYHWNVTGPNFIGLHELFDVQYSELNAANDALAERIRALGHFTPGTVKEFLTLSHIQDDAALPTSCDAMIKNLLHAHETCSTLAREVLKIADEAEDEVTVDMMVARMTAHDKAAWMLRSTLQ
jgi:starvation-inducible DNA-binding protein